MTYTRDQLLNSTRRKEDHLPSVSHTGAPHPARYGGNLVDVHEHGAHVVAGMTDHTNVHAAMGRAPKIKRAYTDQIPVHSAAERRTSQGVALGGQHSSALDAISGAMVPTKDGSRSTPPLPKGFANSGGSVVKSHLRPVEIYPGMRSRVNDSLEGQMADVQRAQGKRSRDQYRDETAELSRRIFDEAVGPTQSGHARPRR